MNRHHTAVAAEAFAAALFAHAGYSVFVQYGANHPGYDLLVSDGAAELRVNAKGSSDGVWLLASKEKGKTYEVCRSEWIARNHGIHFLFVQFEKVPLGAMPRCYLASSAEVAEHLKIAWYGEISLAIPESRTPSKGKYAGQTAAIPNSWAFSAARVKETLSATSARRA